MGEIEKYRDKGIMYKDIANYLKGRGFRSSRGKELSAKLIERMLTANIIYLLESLTQTKMINSLQS